MNDDPVFVTWEEVLVIHRKSIERFGGTHGIRDENLVRSALGAAMNDFYYAQADVAGIAAAYAFHIAQAQAFLDGNKRTAIGSALVFLERNEIDTKTEWGDVLYESLHAVAEKRLDKQGLAARLRDLSKA